MKKLIFSAALVLSLGLAACGDDTTTSTPETTTPTTEASETVEQKEGVNEQQTVADFYKEDIPLMTDDILSLSETSYDFIKSNEDIFPANDETTITKAKNMVDPTIEFKHLDKNVEPYLEKIISVTGTVIEIEEVPLEDFTFTVIHILDDNFNSYQSILYKTADDVFQEDVVTLIGLPLGPSYFENVSGGTTNVQVLAASLIEK